MLGRPFRGLVQSGTSPQRDPVRHAQRPTRRRGPRTPRAPDPPLYRSPRREPHPVVTPDPQLVAGWRRLPQPRARHERPQNQRRGLMRHRTTSLTNTESGADDIPRLVLDWRESGVIMPLDVSRRGYGRELIERA